MRIGIVGIGGVGGFIGAKLAAKYRKGSAHEIIFIARGKSVEAIEKNGVVVESNAGEFVGYPAVVSSDSDVLGVFDVLIIATKSYDLQSAVLGLGNAIGKSTLLLPLLNGVNSKAQIHAVLPNAMVADACIFIVADLLSPGRIKHYGGKHRLSFGTIDSLNFDLKGLAEIFQDAGINTVLESDIKKVIWEKYIFISSVASLTTYTDLTLGEILENPELHSNMKELLAEVAGVAIARKVDINPGVIQNSLDSMRKLPFETTSSMQRDFRRGKKSELENLCGFVVSEAEKLNIASNFFSRIYAKLQ